MDIRRYTLVNDTLGLEHEIARTVSTIVENLICADSSNLLGAPL